ncbi:hypothetical protein PROFUN_13631 [Planoprotostelium fungivorum]|uniref:Rho GDP-dissociation inhibitor 1-like n=1 Tax=Planoprotostelium fungivorum TaxID=1890364 RepID=A0A2P6MZW7_9EUKA|nr:hypothetical protein PROFUN_13631 [Planoprotostelium fungivorum]
MAHESPWVRLILPGPLNATREIEKIRTNNTQRTHMQQQEASEKMAPVVMSPDTGVSGLGMRLRMLYTLSQSIERKEAKNIASEPFSHTHKRERSNMSTEEDQTNVPDYKVSQKVTVAELLNKDTEDESLKKYKESLLGAAASKAYSPAGDPRRVVINEMRVIAEGRPGGDIVYKLGDKQAIEDMKKSPFTLKEGCKYKITIIFTVQHDIVSGLKYVNSAYRASVRVHKEETMIGSFAPQEAPYTMTFPRNGFDEAPSGMLARGSYKAKSQFIDDDKENHLEYEYAFDIKKDW